MRFMSGETYIEAVGRKRYKSIRWAWKAAARAGKWWTVKQNSYGRYRVVPMTRDEIIRAQRNIFLNQIVKEVYDKAIEEELKKPSTLHTYLR